MPSDQHITARDLRDKRRPGPHAVVDDEPTPRRRYADDELWDWTPGLTRDERKELEELRAERAELLARVEELHVAAQDADDRERALRNLVTKLATCRPLTRRRLRQELRRRGMID
jgi:recombinational DNA repair ATPase RecF